MVIIVENPIRSALSCQNELNELVGGVAEFVLLIVYETSGGLWRSVCSFAITVDYNVFLKNSFKFFLDRVPREVTAHGIITVMFVMESYSVLEVRRSFRFVEVCMPAV